MKCPHCLDTIHSDKFRIHLTPAPFLGTGKAPDNAMPSDADGLWCVQWEKCPSCKRVLIDLEVLGKNKKTIQVHPKGVARSPLSKDVPPDFATDYLEACLVLADSPKASAALSRRCLQNVIQNHYGIKKPNLSKEIDEVIAQKTFPSFIADDIDGVRNLGNFAAHAQKNIHSGEIVDVEPKEAEWLLDILEAIFDFAFVQPANAKRKRDALDAKLSAVGKPPMK